MRTSEKSRESFDAPLFEPRARHLLLCIPVTPRWPCQKTAVLFHGQKTRFDIELFDFNLRIRLRNDLERAFNPAIDSRPLFLCTVVLLYFCR